MKSGKGKGKPFLKSGLGDEAHTRALHANLNRYRNDIRPGLKAHSLELPGQPLDRFYLRHSKLFSFSRKKFLEIGGTFSPTLMSSERSLSSFGLVSNEIEYTPHEKELFFRAEEKDSGIGAFIQFSVSTFHEQNHRLFWKTLPAPQKLDVDSLRRYLNFMESLVVSLDMALGDELGTLQSAPGYQTGVIYDPGTDVSFENLRERKNYYHCACEATFLTLEGFNAKRIKAYMNAKHAGLKKPLRDRAIERALKLDQLFVELTNPTWQKKHADELIRFFSKYPSSRKNFPLSEDGGAFLGEYVIAEDVFTSFLNELK
jgi:hypothetical protein